MVIEKEKSITVKNQTFFTKRHTNIIKGIAILAMLFHHLGLNKELNLFDGNGILKIVATQCKVCVSIFLILSGYGLNSSLNNNGCSNFKDIVKFSLKHLLKLMISFWTIFIVFIVIGNITRIRGIDIYGANKSLNIFIDFMGLADLFSTPTYNATWWFMSLIIILYLILPILKLILKRSPIALVIIAMILRNFNVFTIYSDLNRYLIVFCLGMIFSEFNLFDRLRNLNKSKIDRLIVTIIFLIFGIFSRYKLGNLYDVVAAFAIIFISNNIFANIKGINSILGLLGKHSSNIFMLHTFIYKYFFNEYFAKLKYWLLMYIVLIVSSLIISMIIEHSKKAFKEIYKKIKKQVSICEG